MWCYFRDRNDVWAFGRYKKGEIPIRGLTYFKILVTTASSQNLYLGNTETKEFLDYYECKNVVKSIPEENIIIFNSKDDATKKEYVAIEGCT